MQMRCSVAPRTARSVSCSCQAESQGEGAAAKIRPENTHRTTSEGGRKDACDSGETAAN